MAQGREEIEKKLSGLEQKVAIGDPKTVAKLHDQGNLTARERVDQLLDSGTFVEEFMLAETQCIDFGMAQRRLPSDGVVTGFGKIDGRPVYVYSQDRSVLAGSVGSAHAEKIAYVIQTARKLGVPVIGLNDSAGARIQEGLSVTSAIGKIFFENSIASGCIPQISAIMGPCIGVGSYSPALTDFILQVQNTSQMFITGPAVIKEVLGETVTMEELGGAKIHSEVSGVTDLVAKNDQDCLLTIRKLIGFLPSSFESLPPRKATEDDPSRMLDTLEKIVPEDTKRAYNIVQVIKAIVDDGNFLELKPKFARNLVIGFGRLDGHPVGFVANQPMFLAGSLDVDASDKAARFIRFCDCFNIPVVTFVDVPGFLPGTAQEFDGIIRHGAKLLYAYAEATVPKVTIVTRKAYGGGYIVMSSKHLRGDVNLAYPTAEIAVMGPEGAINIVFREALEKSSEPAKAREQMIAQYRQTFANPFKAAEAGFIDAVIYPEDTRPTLIRSLEMLKNKRDHNPPKKHGNIPL